MEKSRLIKHRRFFSSSFSGFYENYVSHWLYGLIEPPQAKRAGLDFVRIVMNTSE